MNKQIVGIIFAVTGIIILSLGLFTYIYQTTYTQTEAMQPLEVKTFELDLTPGDKVQGTVTILDGSEGISFYVENPAGEFIYNGGTVYNSVDFSFNSKTTGTHVATFTNLNHLNEQTIEYSFTYPALPNLVSLAVTILGVFLVLIGLTFLVILHKAKVLNSK